MRIFRGVPLTLLLAAITASAFATETGTMRCDRGIVSIGDTIGEVGGKCGPPAFTSQREQKKVQEGPAGSRERIVTTITVDDWTFNFGPNEFQYRVLLENGRVARIESLDYGY